jgi:cell wall-associated NlpC family hydrolase
VTSRVPGRHRAAVRPKTPLSTLATQVTAGAGTVGRRGAVLAASSGLVVSLGVSAADAAPVIDLPGRAGTAGGTDTTPAPQAAPAADEATEAVQAPLTVPADANVVAVSAVAGQVVAPPPPPPPPPPRATTRASRSGERAATKTSSESRSESESASYDTLSASRENVIAVAARYVGVPYRYGGTSPSGFDCSGYVQYVFGQVGISLPRSSGAIAGSATKISRDQAQPGDLVYKPGHIGIYAGGNMMYDAPSSGGSVSKREMWSSDFGFYRVLNG